MGNIQINDITDEFELNLPESTEQHIPVDLSYPCLVVENVVLQHEVLFLKSLDQDNLGIPLYDHAYETYTRLCDVQLNLDTIVKLKRIGFATCLFSPEGVKIPLDDINGEKLFALMRFKPKAEETVEFFIGDQDPFATVEQESFDTLLEVEDETVDATAQDLDELINEPVEQGVSSVRTGTLITMQEFKATNVVPLSSIDKHITSTESLLTLTFDDEVAATESTD